MSLDLVKTLVSQLGVTEGQASGGAGLLFKMAQDKLSSGDFSKLSSALPEVNQLIGVAPSTSGGIMGMIGKALGGNVGDLASLAGAFSKLGLDPSMVQKFVPVVLGFVQEKGGSGVADILKQVLKG